MLLNWLFFKHQILFLQRAATGISSHPFFGVNFQILMACIICNLLSIQIWLNVDISLFDVLVWNHFELALLSDTAIVVVPVV